MLTSHNRVRVEFTSGHTEKRHHTYPPEALQQLTRNAVMHRSYEGTNAPVRIYWFDDRIEISSVGGPFGVALAQSRGEMAGDVRQKFGVHHRVCHCDLVEVL